ncbi:MAG: AmmeMemoRadiSam system protein B [Elusimicrobiota bacterium]
MPMLLNGPIPPLRPDLEASPAERDGRPVMVLTDVLGLDDKAMAVPHEILAVAVFFDGARRAADVRGELAAQRVFLSESEIQNIAEVLESHGLLDTPESRAARARRLADFRAAPVRPWPGRRRGLPENALELAAFLGGFASKAGGPGEFPASGDSVPPLGLVAPHIDFFRGGPCYAWAYREAARSRPPDVLVALGTAHMSPQSPWTLTRKDYQTPFGPLKTDLALFDEVRARLWYDPLEDEWVHAKEHSLEFQAAWLKHVWRDRTPAWLPILCSGFDRFCTDRPPSSLPSVEGALAAVGDLLAEKAVKGQRVMILAGVDFAHVGRRFGDDFDITPAEEKRVEDADRSSLAKALALDADGFFLAGAGPGAWRRVCGLSPLYTALRWIRAAGGENAPEGRLLSYGQAPDPAGGTVSFAAAVFP